jgi:hypothetical protein
LSHGNDFKAVTGGLPVRGLVAGEALGVYNMRGQLGEVNDRKKTFRGK